MHKTRVMAEYPTESQIGVLYMTYFWGPTDEYALDVDTDSSYTIAMARADIEWCELQGWVRRQPNRFARDADREDWMMANVEQIEWAMTDAGEDAWRWLAPLYGYDY
jgi:hypothetical protein